MIVWEAELGRPSHWAAQRIEFQSGILRVAVSVCGKPSDLEANLVAGPKSRGPVNRKPREGRLSKWEIPN